MTEASHANAATPHARNTRREDGIIYKGMAAIIFAFVAVIVTAKLTLHVGGDAFAILFVLTMLVFDVGWDLAMRATGRGEMLATTVTTAIFANALRRCANAGATIMAVSYVSQDASRLKWVIVCLVIWWAADILSRRTER